jgi:hypothetical protein
VGAAALAISTAAVNSIEAAPHYPWHKSYRAVVDQTAAVVEGTAASIEESYNEQEGPRTLVTLSQLKVLWGELRGSNVVLRLFGGPVPGRRGRVDEIHIPTFVRGKRYLVFLSNRDWRLSPVTARQAFIIERVHGKDLLVTTDGHALSGIDDVVGPKRGFPVYRIPREVDENFVPAIDDAVTRSMVARVYSAAEFVAHLKAWATRNRIAVNGSFNDKPYRVASWRIAETTSDRSSAGAPPEKELEFAPKAGRPARPEREKKPCSERAAPADADPRDRSTMCEEGGPQ